MASKGRSSRFGRGSISEHIDRPDAAPKGGSKKRKADQPEALPSKKSARFVKVELDKPKRGRPKTIGREALQVDSLVVSSAVMPKADGSHIDHALHHAPVASGAAGAGNTSGVTRQAGEEKAKRGRGRPRKEAAAMPLAQTQTAADDKRQGPVANASHAEALERPAAVRTRTRGRPRKVDAKVGAATHAEQDGKEEDVKEQVAKEPETKKRRKRGRPPKAATAQAAAPGDAICKSANELVKSVEQPVASGKLPSPAPKGRENAAPDLPGKDSGALPPPVAAQASLKPLSTARQVQMASGPVQPGLAQPCAPAHQPHQDRGPNTSACQDECAKAEVQRVALRSGEGVITLKPGQQEASACWPAPELQAAGDTQSLGDKQGCVVLGTALSQFPETVTVTAAAPDPDWFDPADPAKVRTVESAIHRSHAVSGGLPLGRDAQTSQLSRLLQEHAARAQGGSIYVSGMPGTGKSLSVDEVARQFARADAPVGQPMVISVNCMSLPQPRAIYRRVLDHLQQSTDLKAGTADPEACPLDLLKEAVRALPAKGRPTKSRAKAKPQGMVLLILDEIDQLVTKDQAVLYELFALPQLKGSRLILVGISNSIDLTHRTLPKLQEMGSHPAEIPFPSYSAQQVQAIVQQRLATLPGPAFQTAALAFCARKVAARSGDMRRALEACSCALQHLVVDVRNATAEQEDDKDAEFQPAAARIAPAASRARRRLVGVGEMAKAISSLQGGSGEASVAVQAMRALPQQQQLVMCATATLLGQADNANAAGSPSVSVGPATPASILKARPRMVSFMSPAAPFPRRGSTPARGPPGTPTVSRSKLLGSNLQACALGVLHESYSQLCKQIAINPLSSSEFAEACSMLEDMGLLGLSKAREPRLRRVTLRAHKDDVALALQDVRLLRNVLSLA